MNVFERENFVRVNQFDSLLHTIERNNYENNNKIIKLTDEIVKLRADFESRIDKLNNISLFNFIKLKLKKKQIC